MGLFKDWAKCVDCSKRAIVRHREWIRSAPPRCIACGGRLEPSDAAKDDHAAHHDAKKDATSIKELKKQGRS